VPLRDRSTSRVEDRSALRLVLAAESVAVISGAILPEAIRAECLPRAIQLFDLLRTVELRQLGGVDSDRSRRVGCNPCQVVKSCSLQISPHIANGHPIADSSLISQPRSQSFRSDVPRGQGEDFDVSAVELGKSISSLQTRARSAAEVFRDPTDEPVDRRVGQIPFTL